MKETNNNEQKQEGKPLLSVLREMEVGESHSFPAERGSYLKSACTTFGFEWGKIFTTATNRADRTISVTRVE